MKNIIFATGASLALSFSLIQDAQGQTANEPNQPAKTNTTSTPEGWMEDLEAAKALAAKEKKVVLIDFTGSDWCKWCVQLEREVFSQKEFEAAAKDKYVLVYIDMPRDKSVLSAFAKKNNPELAKKYGIHGFPSILLLSPDGTILGQTGYKQGGPVAYLAHLEEVLLDGKALIDLQTALKTMPKGPERAKKIDAVTRKFSTYKMRENEALILEILETDADGKLGLREHYPYYVNIWPLEKRLKVISDAMDKGLSEGMTMQERANANLVKQKGASILLKHLDELQKIKTQAQTFDGKLNEDLQRMLDRIIRRSNDYIQFAQKYGAQAPATK